MDGPLQLPMAHEDDADALVWDGFWIGMGWHGIGMDHGGWLAGLLLGLGFGLGARTGVGAGCVPGWQSGFPTGRPSPGPSLA